MSGRCTVSSHCVEAARQRVRQAARTESSGAGAKRHQWHVRASPRDAAPQVAILHVEQLPSVRAVGRALALLHDTEHIEASRDVVAAVQGRQCSTQGAALADTHELEDDHARVMPRRDQVLLWVHRKHPESVVLAPERLNTHALLDVPDADGAVLRVRDDEVVLRVEHDTADVVRVSAQRVHLPRLGLVHAPELHLSVVRTGDDEVLGRVEGRPVHAAVVAL